MDCFFWCDLREFVVVGDVEGFLVLVFVVGNYDG